MNLKPLTLAFAAAAVFAASSAMAATGTSSAATSMDGISTAFLDWLGGSGGTLILVLGVIISAAIMLIRPNIGVAATTLGVAAIVGYGVPALTGFAGVTATIPDMLPFTAVMLPPGL